MTRRLVLSLAGVAALALGVVLFLLTRHHDDPVAEFRSVERQCIATFNDALHRQRANEIDERMLGDVLDRDVLPPWRTMRAHLESAELPERIRPVLRRYLADRQLAWEAYSAALHAPDDNAAQPAYATYHQKNSEADADARELGPLLR